MKRKISQLMFNKYRDCTPQLPDYNLTADCKWIRHKSGLPWLPLDILVPVEAILSEIKNIESLLTDHRDEYAENVGWKSFCIHGKSYNATREDAYYNDTRPHSWTPEAIERMPNTVNYFLNHWPKTQFSRLRVMLLESGGHITIHSDSVISALSPINIAITQPTDCVFVMENFGVIPFVPGSAYMLDVSNRHTVFNNSPHPRWHIIIHQAFDQIESQNMVASSYKKMYNKQ